jgi:predicted component of type VI protein secretion system
MPSLKLKLADKSFQSFRIDKGVSVTIGRHSDNDIVLENRAVSGRHAEIEGTEQGFYITDFHSKNGTFVNHQLVISHKLQHGDIITISKHEMRFLFEDNESQHDEEDTESIHETLVMDTSDHRSKLAQGVSDIASREPAKKMLGALSFFSGGQGDIPVDKEIVTVGKGPDCDVIIRGLLVGNTAFLIQRDLGNYILKYIEGMAKPKVNYRKVHDEIVLNEFDVIEIGSAKFQFRYLEFPNP